MVTGIILLYCSNTIISSQPRKQLENSKIICNPAPPRSANLQSHCAPSKIHFIEKNILKIENF